MRCCPSASSHAAPLTKLRHCPNSSPTCRSQSGLNWAHPERSWRIPRGQGTGRQPPRKDARLRSLGPGDSGVALREVLPSALRGRKGSLPSSLTCSCGSETADGVATAQGLGTQGLRAGRPGVLNSTTAAVPIIEPQHMFRHLVVRRQVRTRVTTCRAVVCPNPAGLREVQARSLSLRQVQAEATQPQTQ